MEFVGDIARKKGKLSLLAVEAIKSQRAGEIGRSSGLFYVPKVIDFDEKTGVLEFERLRGLVTLLDLAIKKDPRLFGLLEKTGRALSAIHQQLVLPDELKHELPPEWMGTMDENVFIHGDFALCNLSFHETSGQLIILDWSAAPIIGRTPTFGSRFFDILWFASSLFHGAPSKSVLNWDAEKMTSAFLTGCGINTSSEGLNRFNTYVKRICRLHKKQIWHLVYGQRTLVRALACIIAQMYMYARLCLYLHKCCKSSFA